MPDGDRGVVAGVLVDEVGDPLVHLVLIAREASQHERLVAPVALERRGVAEATSTTRPVPM